MDDIKRTLVCIIGKSGSGKSTLANHLVQIGAAVDFPSFTTRYPREGEEDEKDHYFITDDKANELLQNKDDILAFYQRGDVRYFTLKSALPKTIIPIVYVINPDAYMKLYNKFKDDPSMNIVGIYLSIPNDAQLKNLQKRNDDKKTIESRLNEENEEFNSFYNVVNNIHAYASNKKNSVEIVQAYNENTDIFLKDATNYFYSILVAHGIYDIDVQKPFKNNFVEESSWDTFRNTGLLFLINQFLHAFGWAIVLEYKKDENGNRIINRAYPAKVKFRGFSKECSDDGYSKIAKYMKNHGKEIYDETIESIED